MELLVVQQSVLLPIQFVEQAVVPVTQPAILALDSACLHPTILVLLLPLQPHNPVLSLPLSAGHITDCLATVTGHVSMSILGGGTLNYQTSSSTSTSIAVARSVPDMTLWVQCLGLAFVIVMGMLVVL